MDQSFWTFMMASSTPGSTLVKRNSENTAFHPSYFEANVDLHQSMTPLLKMTRFAFPLNA